MMKDKINLPGPDTTPVDRRVVREFTISSGAVDNRTSIFILTFIIVILGILSYRAMPKENFPEIVLPTIFIGTTYPGNSPVDMENLITRPIEKELNALTGVKSITSTSVQDFSSIVVEFNFDVEPSKALLDAKDAVDRSKGQLPSDLDREPNIREFNFSQFPIMNINLSGDFNMEELKMYAEYLEDRIEALTEISEVEIKGSQDREVKVMVNLPRMESMEISFDDIENAIRSENVTISGGDLLSDGVRRNIRIVGEFEDVSDMNDIIVKRKDQNVVFLRDIADVSFDYVDRSSYARSNRFPVVSLDVKKRSGENLLDASDKIKEIIADAKQNRLPQSLDVHVSNDQSKMTRMQLTNLENSIISGIILVVLVLLFFMGLRNSVFVGIAIPMSMLTGFLILSIAGVTLNLMVLFSLILALGMLVDNGIVVVENIYRLMQEGYSPVRASKEGVGEVAWPIITSTLTTLAAFAPLLFWDQIMGEFMKYLPITLMIVLSSSLFVALVINPVLTSSFMKVEKENKKPNLRNFYIAIGILISLAAILTAVDLATPGDHTGVKIARNLALILAFLGLLNEFVLKPLAFRFQNTTLPKIERAYHSTITFALKGRKPYIFFGGTLVLLIVSIALLFVRAPNVNFFPVNEPQYVNVFIETPLGTDIQETNEITKRVENRVLQTLQPYMSGKDSVIESVIANVGAGTSDANAGPTDNRVTPHKARITVAFVEYEHRNGISTIDLMEKMRDNLQDFPGVTITVDKNRVGPPVGKPINIEISGDDYELLVGQAEDLKLYVQQANIPGIEELKLDIETGTPELIVHVDRTAAKRFGVSTANIGTNIRTALFGKEVSKFKSGEDDYPVMLRLNEDYRYNLQTLLNQRVTFRDQASGKILQVPISAVADIEYSSTFGSIRRKKLQRVVTLYSNVIEGYNATAINHKIEEHLAGFQMPDGYTWKFTGEQEEQAKAAGFLMTAMLVAVFLIFLIIVAQFNSIYIPFIIMASVIFSTIGVFLGLAVFRMDFIVIMTGIGIISLAGVVVNNAIVLMDYTNLVRTRKRTELGLENTRLPENLIIESIIEGGITRLRPVLLTAITTILGLIPLAVGLNIDFFGLLRDFNPNIYTGGDNVVFWGPMAWTVIFGLTFSTFLTLVIVPVMYLLADRLQGIGKKTYETTSPVS